MRTDMDCRSLGERGSNYTTKSSSSLHQMKQKDTKSKKEKVGIGAGGFAAGLLAGAGVGVVAGLLLAPDRGTSTRRKVTESARRYSDQVNDWTKKMNKGGGQTNARVNEAPDLPPTTATGRAVTSTGGPAQNSPYTDTNKRSDRDVNNMINDPRNPGGPTTPPATGGTTTPPATGGPTPTTPPKK